MKLRFWLAPSIALALGGCDFAPRYAPPSMILPAAFKDEPKAAPVGLPSSGAWWVSFNDRTLNDLEAQVDAANPDLAAAVAANDVAVARAEQAAAGLLPQIDAIGQITANRQSNNRPTRGANQPDYYGNNILGGQVSYEIDIWGRVRDLAKAANLTAEASADALANARLELHAELARAYIDLRGLDDEARLISDTIGIYRAALNLTKSRTRGADRLAGRRRPRADATELRGGSRLGHRPAACGAGECGRRPGWQAGAVLHRRASVETASVAETTPCGSGRRAATTPRRRGAGAPHRRRQ